MTRTINESRLRALISTKTGGDAARLAPDDDLVAALDLDSLGGLELLADVEQRFDVYFDDAQLARPHTMTRILDAIDDASGGARS